MKNIYLTIAILFFCFTGCKDKDTTDENSTTVDTTSISNESLETNDSLTSITDSTDVATDTADAHSNVKLPNKMSATATVIPGEKGKYPLAETKWKLTEINDKPVDVKSGRDYFINFDSKSGKFKAYVGCNSITGSYFMKSAKNLGFTNIISTRKACDNMDVERDFFNNLQKTDGYMISGKVMHLHVGKKAVAKFEAIR